MSVETGNEIADSILAMLGSGINKEAAAGDPTSGNNVKVELDEMEAQHTSRVTRTPREGKTVTEVAKALAAKTPGQQEDDVHASEGNSQAAVTAVPSDIEKSAAIDELMSEGASFDDAVELVKQASFELEVESVELEKAAAVSALISEGIPFDEAIEKIAAYTGSEYTDLEKAAAVSELMVEDGLEFDEAVELIKEASLKSRAAPKVRVFADTVKQQVKGAKAAAEPHARAGAKGFRDTMKLAVRGAKSAVVPGLIAGTVAGKMAGRKDGRLEKKAVATVTKRLLAKARKGARSSKTLNSIKSIDPSALAVGMGAGIGGQATYVGAKKIERDIAAKKRALNSSK